METRKKTTASATKNSPAEEFHIIYELDPDLREISITPQAPASQETIETYLTVPAREYHMSYDPDSKSSVSSFASISEDDAPVQLHQSPTSLDPIRLHTLLCKLQSEYKDAHSMKAKLVTLTPKKTNKDNLDDLVKAAALLLESQNLLQSLNVNNPKLTKLISSIKTDFDNLMMKLQDTFTTKAMSHGKSFLDRFSKPRNLNAAVAQFITTLNSERSKHVLYRGIGLILQEYYETAKTQSPHAFKNLNDYYDLRAENRLKRQNSK